jgi:hypothetical protein
LNTSNHGAEREDLRKSEQAVKRILKHMHDLYREERDKMREEAFSFTAFLAQTQERDEYWRTHLLPFIQQFLRSAEQSEQSEQSEQNDEQNDKRWTYCVMLFTAFLPSERESC